MERRQLGKTKLTVSRIGISSSFGADQAVYEEAFERGCNYFTWGTFIKGRSRPFKNFVRQIEKTGQREKLVLGLLSYSHSSFLGEVFFQSARKQLGTSYIDALLLGYFSRRPPQRLLDWAFGLKERGLVGAVGITTHNRKIVAPLADEGVIDYFHIRYNAVHRGAEQEIFPFVGRETGLVSFTATSWKQLLSERKIPPGLEVPTAGDCYRFVLRRDEIDCCMMGVKDLSMLRQNFNELERGPMTDEEAAGMITIGDYIHGR